MVFFPLWAPRTPFGPYRIPFWAQRVDPRLELQFELLSLDALGARDGGDGEGKKGKGKKRKDGEESEDSDAEPPPPVVLDKGGGDIQDVLSGGLVLRKEKTKVPDKMAKKKESKLMKIKF